MERTSVSSRANGRRERQGSGESALTLLTCREWEELPVGRKGVAEAEADRFHVLAERAARRLKLPETGVLVRTHGGLKAGQVVGVLAIPGRTLEILPKIDGDAGAVRGALVRMLSVAHDLRVADGASADMETQRHDLLELLVRLFADRLLNAVRHGLPRRYVAHEADLAALRGRLDVTRQFTHLAIRPDRLACRFGELSEDTPLNRVLKAAVVRLARLGRSAASARTLSELVVRFERTGDSLRPLGEPVRLDRTNADFHALYRLARLFLAGDWQSTAAGGAVGFALLFPMNDLFEAFVGRSLRRALAPRRVRLQARGQYALADGSNRPLFALRPDVVIEPPDERVVLDTKWKTLKAEREDLGVAPADIYQMLTYARAYEAARAVLLYPWHAGVGERGIVRRWTAAGSGLPLDVVAIDVGRPEGVAETLRRVVADQTDLDGPAAVLE